MMRIGYGYDSHAFAPGDHLYIGGVKIAFTQGVNAHSDGDVLLHAIGDALLGAAAIGDLGQHFPDKDPSYQDMASTTLLSQIMDMLKNCQYQVVNVDATVITELPKLAPHKEAMCQSIAELLEISTSQVSVKASTNEKMGWIGQGQGLAAHAVVLLETIAN